MDYKAGAKQSSGPIIADGLAITDRSCEPEGGPDEEHLAAIAYILQANGFEPGEPLPGDEAELREIGFER